MLAAQQTQRAFSLLELLVALVVFSVGLLAIAGLQTVSKQANFEAIQRTSASHIAYGLLEDMRTNGDAIDIYAAAGEVGNGSRGNEPAPNCHSGEECNSAEKAAYDLWHWEQAIDGSMASKAGISTGGLVLPTLCVSGPVGGGAGMYEVTVVWRGGAELRNAINAACGTLTGNYGAENEFRRILQVSTYIDPTM